MIFIALGTQSNDFSRCIKSFEEVMKKYSITETVVAQVGNTMYRSPQMTSYDFVSENEFQEYIKSASVVITHAGSGALFSAIKKRKKIIAVARLSKYGEMIDDHQTELVKKLAEGGYLVDGTYSMSDAWEKIKDFKPREADFKCDLTEKISEAIDKFLKVV